MIGEKEALRIIGDVEIAKLRLGPGDVLVVKVDRAIPSDVLARIYGHVQPNLPAGVKCIVIDPAIELSVLTRVEIEAKAA